MRPGRASATAELVALWRAVADTGGTAVPGFRDPVARRLLGPGASRLLGWVLRGRVRFPPAEVIPLRVATIDRWLLRAVADGVGQLVLLGAGFDTRAWRMPELAGVRVFEVDHPDTQATKRARAEGIPVLAASVTYAPVDFARDRLQDALESAGHAADQPTVWIWEGVVMYLLDPAVRSTLDAVRSRWAPGSTLIVHYHTPNPPGLVSVARDLMFAALGEQHVGLRTPAQVAALLDGFEIIEDTDAADQAALLGAPIDVKPAERTSRVVVAR
jgi:methyltransferase (TIGR00027 family)